MKLHKETGVTYMECLGLLRERKSEAEQLKMENPLRSFTDCLLETGRKYIELEFEEVDSLPK